MSELKRVIKSKTTVMAIIMLLVVALDYWNSMNMSEAEELSISMTSEFLNSDMTYEEWLSIMEAKKAVIYDDVTDIDAAVIEEEALTICINKCRYVMTYKNNMSGICERAARLLVTVKSTGEKAILNKTLSDFERLAKVNVCVGNDYAVENITEYRLLKIVLIIIGIMYVMTFLKERQKGLWSLIYSTKFGRMRLAAKRLLILTSVLFSLSAVMYLIIICMTWLKYDGFDLNRSIQSVSSFEQFSHLMSVGGFLVYYTVIQIVSLITLIICSWFVISVFGNVNIGLLTFVTIMAGEFFAYLLIEPNTKMAVFREINLYALIDPSGWLSNYTNYNIYGMAFELRSLMEAVVVILLVAGSVGAVAAGKLIRPYRYVSLVQIISETELCGRVLEKIPVSLTEFRKFMIWNKGLIVVAIAVLLVIRTYDVPENTYRNSKSMLIQMYDDCDNCEIIYAENYINSYKEKLSLLDASSNETVMLSDNITKLESRLAYAQLMTDKGYDVIVADDTPYKILFGNQMQTELFIRMIFAMFGITLVTWNVFAYEKKCGMIEIANTTLSGRRKVKQRKHGYILIVITVFYVMAFGIRYHMHYMNYGFPMLNKAVQNIELLGNLKIHCNIGVFLVAIEIIRYAGLVIAGYGVAYLGRRRKK